MSRGKTTIKEKKVVIVHDWLYGGGAELVVQELHRLFPDAPIYTSYCTREWRIKLDNKVITGYLQKWPFSKLRKFLPLARQWWFAGLDLSNYDVVISSSGNGEARFARATKPGSIHISYTHSPPHFYYRKYSDYMKEPGFGILNPLARLGLRVLVGPLRRQDYMAAQRIDYLIANSKHIQKDIKVQYKRDSHVVFPPIDIKRFSLDIDKITTKKTHFTLWSRHVPYKRFDIAIKACNILKLPLVVIGTGPETENLKKIAGPTITFTGHIADEDFTQYLSTSKAFIFPAEEDFGIAPVEAQAAGIPVIAFKAGGAKEYVIDGKTGLFFDEQTVPSLIRALRVFDTATFSQVDIARHAKKFSREAFQDNFMQLYKKYICCK